MEKDGRITIRGTHVTSHASGYATAFAAARSISIDGWRSPQRIARPLASAIVAWRQVGQHAEQAAFLWAQHDSLSLNDPSDLAAITG